MKSNNCVLSYSLLHADIPKQAQLYIFKKAAMIVIYKRHNFGGSAMFLYWDGYEIDGSDTDFEIILPESVQMLEFVECYMNMPVFSKTPTPEYQYCDSGCSRVWPCNNCKPTTLEEMQGKLLSNDYTKMAITMNFQHMDLLPPNIQADIWATSASRETIKALNEPAEQDESFAEPFDYTKVENPCITPIVQDYFDRGGMTAQLSVGKDKDGMYAVLNVGPGADFEYVMYVLNYMSERFPSIKIDMENGFSTCCCNFHASSMYQYEKVVIPVKHNVNHTLKHLTEHGLMSFILTYGKKYQPITNYIANGFFAATTFWGYGRKKSEFSFSDYLKLVEMTLAEEPDPVQQMFMTAVNIIMPQPKLLSGEIAPSTTPVTGRTEAIKQILPYAGYMSFYIKDKATICEFRVSAQMKEYLNTWLTKADAGMIDFIKPKMYELRKEQDAQ